MFRAADESDVGLLFVVGATGFVLGTLRDSDS